jgi:O-antigen/teichoic acid export membrane protein
VWFCVLYAKINIKSPSSRSRAKKDSRMEDKKRLSINIIAQLFAFAVGFIINFFLTPFVIETLGAEAYGFIGLANNFVSYTTLITIALNSMAARFITVSFHKGDIESAKKYFASVYYSNLFLAIIIALCAIFTVLFLEYIIQIPSELKWDVKLLFGLTFLNGIIALIANFYLIATFVKNRLYLSSLRNIIANLLKVIFIVMPFLMFPPHLWYYGVSALIATLFIAISNQVLTKKLLPDFKIKKSLYDFGLVKKLIFSGGWNLLSKLSAILSTGFDLLLANLFISVTAMGIFSISKAVPMILLSLFASISAVFAPKLTEFYAKGEIVTLRNELINNIRLMGIFSTAPLIIFIVLGEDFFRLWVPAQDSHILYLLSTISILSFIVAIPQETLWNVFTITDKVKISSLNMLVFSILIFISILISISFFDNEYYQLLSIASVRFMWDGVRSLTFLPIYGAKCLGLKWNTFYPLILKNLFLSIIITIGLLLIKKYFVINTWPDLIISATVTGIITTLLMGFFILSKNQKITLLNYLYKLKL